MSLFEKFRDLVRAEDEFDDYEDDDEPEPQPYSQQMRKNYGSSSDSDAYSRREPLREPLARERERERENVIPLHGREAIKRITEKFNILILEPRIFDECPKLVDSLKNRTPVIINLESIENDTARKIFDFLSGATYALNGNVQKIAQNIFVFVPENVDVQSADQKEDRSADRWRS